jgi:4-aminobutyrate aminotransferase-like enzyme
MPLGAMTARAELMTWAAGAHGSTYGGNPVCCAAALAMSAATIQPRIRASREDAAAKET